MSQELAPGVKRRKRDNYTIMACYPCKARKVKCDGYAPCECCQKRQALCSYPARRGFPQPPTASPLSQRDNTPAIPAENLVDSFDPGHFPAFPPAQASLPARPPTLGGRSNDSPATSGDASIPRAQGTPGQEPQFVPQKTHFAHVFSMARKSLMAKGILSSAEENVESASSFRSLTRRAHLPPDFESSIEPILDLGYEKAKRVLSEYADTIHPIWPCVDLATIQRHLDHIFLYAAAGAEESSISEPSPMSTTNIDSLKAVLGISMLVNNDGASPLGRHLPRYLDWSVERLVASVGIELDDIVMAVLLSLYHFYKSPLIKAWRYIGIASKACLELGLHQKFVAEPSSVSELSSSANYQTLFCCIFVIDHRCSFGLGLPCTIQLEDIDEKRLRIGSSAPFTAIMIEHDCITSDMFPLLNRQNRLEKKVQQHAGFLEYQLLNLRDRFESFVSESDSSRVDDVQLSPQLLRNMRVSLTARVNHTRTLLRVSQLQGSGGVKEDPASAQVVIDCARETISQCAALINESAALGSMRVNFDFFICASLAAILMVVSQHPEAYGEKCRRQFHEALEILAASQHRIFTPRKGCFTFDQLREIGAGVNMPRDPNDLSQVLDDDGRFLASIDFSQSFLAEMPSLDDCMFGLFEPSESLAVI